jgi:hypothetical protein
MFFAYFGHLWSTFRLILLSNRSANRELISGQRNTHQLTDSPYPHPATEEWKKNEVEEQKPNVGSMGQGMLFHAPPPSIVDVVALSGMEMPTTGGRGAADHIPNHLFLCKYTVGRYVHITYVDNGGGNRLPSIDDICVLSWCLLLL